MGQFAARVSDLHTCPMVTPGVPPVPHVGGPILPPGAVTVLIGGLPAATLGDICTCVGPPDAIVQGSSSVMIYGRPAARMGDMTTHGGVVSIGCPTVLIGGPTFTVPSVQVTLENQVWWNPLDWYDLLMDNPPDVYFGNFVIRGSTDYQQKVLRDLQALDATPSGRRLLNSVNSSGHTVTIENYTQTQPNALTFPGSGSTYRGADGTLGTPADARIEYNPDITQYGPPLNNTAPAIIAGHEIIHADHITHGTTPDGNSTNDGLLDASGNPVQERNEELNTAGIPPNNGSGKTDGLDSGVTENDLRRDWPTPQPQRPYY